MLIVGYSRCIWSLLGSDSMLEFLKYGQYSDGAASHIEQPQTRSYIGMRGRNAVELPILSLNIYSHRDPRLTTKINQLVHMRFMTS